MRPTPHFVFGGDPERMRNEVGCRHGKHDGQRWELICLPSRCPCSRATWRQAAWWAGLPGRRHRALQSLANRQQSCPPVLPSRLLALPAAGGEAAARRGHLPETHRQTARWVPHWLPVPARCCLLAWGPCAPAPRQAAVPACLHARLVICQAKAASRRTGAVNERLAAARSGFPDGADRLLDQRQASAVAVARAALGYWQGWGCRDACQRCRPIPPAGLETGDCAISELDLDYGKRYPG